jgi:hypothetical protein
MLTEEEQAIDAGKGADADAGADTCEKPSGIAASRSSLGLDRERRDASVRLEAAEWSYVGFSSHLPTFSTRSWTQFPPPTHIYLKSRNAAQDTAKLFRHKRQPIHKLERIPLDHV